MLYTCCFLSLLFSSVVSVNPWEQVDEDGWTAYQVVDDCKDVAKLLGSSKSYSLSLSKGAYLFVHDDFKALLKRTGYKRHTFYVQSGELTNAVKSAIPLELSIEAEHDNRLKKTNDVAVASAIKSYAEFRRGSEYLIEIAEALLRLSAKIPDESFQKKMRDMMTKHFHTVEWLKQKATRLDKKALASYYVFDRKSLRDSYKFLEDIATQAVKFLKEKHLREILSLKKRIIVQRGLAKKFSLEAIHKNLDDAERLLESMEQQFAGKLSAYLLGSSTEDLAVSIAQIKQDSPGNAYVLFSKACVAISAARKKQEDELIASVQRNSPPVETTVERAAPPSKPIASALDPIVEEPSWIAQNPMVCIFVLLLVVLVLVFFYVVWPATSSEDYPEYDVENPAPRLPSIDIDGIED